MADDNKFSTEQRVNILERFEEGFDPDRIDAAFAQDMERIGKASAPSMSGGLVSIIAKKIIRADALADRDTDECEEALFVAERALSLLEALATINDRLKK